MKAIDLLTWLVKESVNTEGMDIIQVDKDFDYETFFGYQPDGDFPVGEYAYLYSDEVTDVDMQRLGELTEVERYPAHKVYTVRGGKTVWRIPAVRDVFILSVDLAQNRMDVRVLEGMTDED